MNNQFKLLLIMFRHEFKSYWVTPVAYVVAVIFIFLLATLTFTVGAFFERGEASLAKPFFQWHPLLYAVFAPAVGMRTWSDEIRLGTHDLINSFPIWLPVRVLAKFTAAVAFLLVTILLTTGVVVTVIYLGDPDYGKIISGYIGSFLCMQAFVAISCMCSSLTRSQIIAFVLSTAICLILVMLGYAPVSKEIISSFPGSRALVDAISVIATYEHYAPFRSGLIQWNGIAYFTTLTAAALTINCIVLTGRKTR